MLKVTQKDIKNGIAHGDYEVAHEGLAKRSTTTIAMSFGVYGMNGAVIEDNETGKLYAIAARNTLLFQLV